MEEILRKLRMTVVVGNRQDCGRVHHALDGPVRRQRIALNPTFQISRRS
jgi:hypothetical protein